MAKKDDKIRALQRGLLPWYRKNRRELPWRKTKDAYAIWVSEIMLQQTRVEAVIPYYQRFLEEFPTVKALGTAQQDDVLKAWAGLGYYRRARMLHAAARLIVEVHDGQFPEQRDDVLALPGVGRYTAGAILSIAFGQPQPIVDGNVVRVLSRWFRLKGDPRRGPTSKRLWELAAQLVQDIDAGDMNQALMELGATVCLPGTAARCMFCPVIELCEARKKGQVERFPELPKRAELRDEHWAAVVARRRGRLLLEQRRNTSLMDGFWQFPTVVWPDREPFSSAALRERLPAMFREATGLKIRVQPQLFQQQQGISGRHVTFHVFEGQVDGSTGKSLRWLLPRQYEARALTTATKKMLRMLQKMAESPLLTASRSSSRKPTNK